MLIIKVIKMIESTRLLSTSVTIVMAQQALRVIKGELVDSVQVIIEVELEVIKIVIIILVQAVLINIIKSGLSHDWFELVQS